MVESSVHQFHPQWMMNASLPWRAREKRAKELQGKVLEISWD